MPLARCKTLTLNSKKNNQSAIVLKNGKLVYEVYNQKWDGSKTNLIHGQSMTKTVTGLAAGALICSGKIESIDDTLENILQY